MDDLASLLIEWYAWGITWGWYQIALGLFCSTLMFIGLRRSKSLPALVLVVTSYWSAFIIYVLLIGFGFVYTSYYNPCHVLPKPSLSVAPIICMLFTSLQSIFLHMVHSWYRIKLFCVIGVTIVGNSIAAIITAYITYLMCLL